jgi:deoxycytidylate deaminase
MARLRKKVIEYVDVVTGKTPRYARPDEILMNLAYSASHGSKCLKRQVGAVLVDAPFGQMGPVVGPGFNENPSGTSPCVEEKEYGADPRNSVPGRCYRDIVRHKSFEELAKQNARCPACGKPITSPVAQERPWKCAGCSRNLEDYFWPERAMSWCTAIHAEVASILSAGIRARGTTLYTTTFPCFQCAEKIVQAGIKSVVFTEPYPDIRAAERLTIAGIKPIRFEGVRSGRFDEIFSRARPYVAAQRAAMARPSKS